MSAAGDIELVRQAWSGQWPQALETWGRYTRLAEPRWCVTEAEEQAEHLSSSFAMIRLDDHVIVISLRKIVEMHLERFGMEVMAHEIGHHVLAPGDLHDHARHLARIRVALGRLASQASFIANLYTDLLINDRLQRTAGLKMAEIYRALSVGAGKPTRLWTLYMRIYETLWRQPKGTLVEAPRRPDPTLELDASLGARLIRSYASDWVAGSGRFAMLCLPYLQADLAGQTRMILASILDTEKAGEGGLPGGLVEVEEDESTGAIHPIEDPTLSGVGDEPAEPGSKKRAEGDASGRKVGSGPNRAGSTKPSGRIYRSPVDYRDLLASTGAAVSEDEAVVRYYREAARPHLVPFPSRETAAAQDPLPEGLDVWDAGESLDELDWFETAVSSPVVVPGVTTRKRVYGHTEGFQPERRPLDLFLGVDCSGSMVNPALNTSYPVIGGAIMVMSALRAGARVMVTLSGEPGRWISTGGFVDDERQCLGVLTAYLGTGVTFGIPRLTDAFEKRAAKDPPAHIMVLTDLDIFGMLDGKKGRQSGWEIAADALAKARGGGTFVLHTEYQPEPQLKQMRDDGWDVHSVTDWQGVIAFARAFSAKNYGASQ